MVDHNLKITQQQRTGFLADCTQEEFERRIRRLREEMEQHNVDGLLLTQEKNVRYATAYFEVGWIVPAYFYMVFIPRDETLPLAIICPEGDQIQTEASWIETVIRWDFPTGFYTGPVGGDLVEVLAGWIKKLGLNQGVIATEIGAHFRLGLSIEVFDEVRKNLPEVQWDNCEDIIWPVRMIKSKEELRRIREAARISCIAVRTGFEAIVEGISERELANVIAAQMYTEGATEIGFLSLYAGPERVLWADSVPNREITMRPGSLLQFDGGCKYEGYVCDFKRFACLGEPTADQRRFFDLAKESEQAAIDIVAPGVSLGSLYQSSQQVIREAGYGDFVDWCQNMSWSSIGHNVGLDVHEMPGISIDNETVLEPNMVLAIEPFFWHDGKYPLWEVSNKYGCEDLVLVTESGYEILTPESIISRDIWVA